VLSVKYEDTVRVLGIEDIQDFVEIAKEHSLGLGEHSGTEVQFGCFVHGQNGVIAEYDTCGVIVLSCPTCNRVVAQIEVAQQSRPIPMRYKN